MKADKANRSAEFAPITSLKRATTEPVSSHGKSDRQLGSKHEAHVAWIFHQVKLGRTYAAMARDLAEMGCQTTALQLSRWVKRRASRMSKRAELADPYGWRLAQVTAGSDPGTQGARLGAASARSRRKSGDDFAHTEDDAVQRTAAVRASAGRVDNGSVLTASQLSGGPTELSRLVEQVAERFDVTRATESLLLVGRTVKPKE